MIPLVRIRNGNTLLKGQGLLPAGHTLIGKRVRLHAFQCLVATDVNTALVLLAPLTGGLFVRSGANAILAANTNVVTGCGLGSVSADVYLDTLNNFNHSMMRGNLPAIVRLDECWFSPSAVAVIQITELVMWVEVMPQVLEL